MKIEKEDKQYFIVGTIACFLIAAIVTFNIWMWRSPNRPEIPDSSKEEVNIIIRDTLESYKLKTIIDSTVAENKRLKSIIKRKQSNTSQILKQNEINKKKAFGSTDSIIFYLNDSLRTRYNALFNQK